MTDREQDRPDLDKSPLPPGVPEPPDPARVRDLRERLQEDRSSRRRDKGVLDGAKGKQARDIGTYTIIPMMMIAGPLVGYLLGKGWESLFGGAPWPPVIGMLLGVAAAFRQVFLMLAGKGRKK